MVAIHHKTPFVTPSSGGTWQARAIIATKGNQSLLGCILIAVLGRAPDNAPRIVSSAEVNEEGWVIALGQARGQTGDATMQQLCHIDDLVNNFRGLADHLKLSDEDRNSLFTELRAWVSKDHRAAPSFLG